MRKADLATERVEISDPLERSRLVERANTGSFLCFVGGGLIERWAPEIIANFARWQPRLRVPYGVLGLGVGEFDYAPFHDSLRCFADHAAFFYTRDAESVGPFVRAGARRPPTVGADVVFAAEFPRPEGAARGTVAANFRDVPYPDLTGDIEWKAWSAALRQVGVRFLIGDCSEAQRALGIPVNRLDAVDAIREAGVVVAMRYHVALLTAVSGGIPLPICYCPKVTRLAHQLGVGDFRLALDDHARLAGVIDQALRSQAELRETIRVRVRLLAQVARAMLDAAVGHVREGVRA